MTPILRDYQTEAVDAILDYVRGSLMPCMIEAPTGAGKSLIIAAVAEQIFKMTGKRILVTAPTKELVIQNRAKFLATGNPASMYSASAGAKSLKHPVVFGSPLTIKGNISAFKRNFAMIINDECDLLTPTIRSIMEQMQEGNPNLRIVGLTATPYRMLEGFIFREWPDGRINDDSTSRNPFYHKCVFRIEARRLINEGYLTTPRIGGINSGHYDTSHMHLNRLGKWDAKEVDRAFVGHGRKTAGIVSDIVSQSRSREGVLIFAATVQHAQEVLASLPPSLSAIITGETKDRASILARFERREIKYIVNCGVLTVGVDLPHVDVIALMRKTESVRLLQQIIGRGLRLNPPWKTDCLTLDYGENLESHCPDGDLFAPVISARAKKEGGKGISAKCPDCSYINTFSCQEQYLDYPVDENGYCLDVFGSRIETDYGPLPAHYGRRCFGHVPSSMERGKLDRCSYRWSGRPCPHCDEPNDLAARHCYSCKGEIVDPNKVLRGEFKAMKRDVHLPQCDRVLSMECKNSVSQAGNEILRVDWVTPYRQFSVFLMVKGKSPKQQEEYDRFMRETDNGNVTPRTIGYRKEDSKFFRILSYNQPEDEEPSVDMFKRTG